MGSERKIILFFIITILTFNLGIAKKTSQSGKSEKRYDHLEFPLKIDNEVILKYNSFRISLNKKYKLANWAAYELNSKMLDCDTAKRPTDYKNVPGFKSLTTKDKDFEKSGFERGHLVPFADIQCSRNRNKTFHFSNIVPMRDSLNKGTWKDLENQVRSWAKEYDTLYIVTGPLLINFIDTIGNKNKILVPGYYYKVIAVNVGKLKQGIGFIIPNDSVKHDFRKFAVSIDSVQKVTGIDFFPKLYESTRLKIECKLELNNWIWNEN